MPAVCRARTHMLNATYIWYSSIASTNCPQESKSVAFLKLACHFWTVLLTSDMLAGWRLAALSGQHSRGGGSSTGASAAAVQAVTAASSARLSAVQSRTDTPVTPRPSPFCLLTLISHPQETGSPARSAGCARFGTRGRSGWTATGCGGGGAIIHPWWCCGGRWILI